MTIDTQLGVTTHCRLALAAETEAASVKTSMQVLSITCRQRLKADRGTAASFRTRSFGPSPVLFWKFSLAPCQWAGKAMEQMITAFLLVSHAHGAPLRSLPWA